jgi:5'-deoxynucleotidase YfbR-like HD superfamily hydrolase
MITNYKKQVIDIFNLSKEDVYIEDAIMGLPNICRYNGRTEQFFSVAQHSVELSRYLKSKKKEELRPLALLHDAAECYIGDIIYPIKVKFPEFLELEEQLSKLFYLKYKVPHNKKLLKEFDFYDKNISVSEMKHLNIWEENKDLSTHVQGLKNCVIFESWKPAKARKEFIKEILDVFCLSYDIDNIRREYNYV